MLSNIDRIEKTNGLNRDKDENLYALKLYNVTLAISPTMIHSWGIQDNVVLVHLVHSNR